VAGYSAFRIFEESLRIDDSEHFLGLRLNFYVAGVLTIVGLAWFVISQRRTPAPVTEAVEPPEEDGTDDDSSDETNSAETESADTELVEIAPKAESDDEETAKSDDAVAGDRK
jgi:hypothetical protein